MALDVALKVGYRPGENPSVIARRLEDELGDRRLPGGETGFFYPERFSFGQPVYLSELIARASSVAGVTEVVATTFERLGSGSGAALKRGFVEIGELEIAMLHDDPATPQLGRIRFELEADR